MICIKGGKIVNFQDKVVIVTGAAVGIGRATAIAFAEENAKVIVADIDVEKGKQVSSYMTNDK